VTGAPVTGPPAPIGVVLLSYGAPAGAEDVERYYTDIRRGRRPTEEQLADLRARYEAIGGTSPLAARTRAQAEGVQRALDAAAGVGRYRVWWGAKHSPPFIEEAVDAAAGAGADEVVAAVLAPHYSALSVGEYLERVEEAAARHGIGVRAVRSWHLEPGLVEALAARVGSTLADLASGEAGPPPHTFFTAHSLPARLIGMGDPYPEQLQETAAAVAERAGLARSRWSVAWQSAARTPEPWLGPDVVEAMEKVAADGVEAVVVCPAGFTSDHLEILYDLDVVARGAAERLGLRFARTTSLNDDPALCDILARVVMGAG